MPTPIRRRAVLGAPLALPLLGSIARAQDAPVRLGTLTPLTGAGGAYGPAMAKAVRSVVDQVNAAGGVLGRPVVLVSEDDETNPDAGVRAARKLVDLDRVVAILGTWASAVTTAVAPICYDNGVMLFTVSGGDAITRLPHRGYIVRTQPDATLQSRYAVRFMLGQGVKKVGYLSAQTPFAAPIYAVQSELLKAGGAEAVGNVIYDASKTTFRSEIDSILSKQPDTLFLNSYQPDLQVLLRELYQAGYDGRRYTLSYAANDKLLASVPASVTEGLVSYAPSPDLDSPAYKAVQAIVGSAPDPYSCQAYDHANLALLAMAKGGAATAQAIHDNVRAITDDAGTPVHSAVEGMRVLAAGGGVNYQGASGPCRFTPIGDISGCRFRFDVAEKGHQRLLQML